MGADQGPAVAQGWAVVTDFKIDINTVSETRRGALVNWLVRVAGIMIYQWHTDEEIETLWHKVSRPNQICTIVNVQEATTREKIVELRAERIKRKKK
jgi:hypothetical protein